MIHLHAIARDLNHAHMNTIIRAYMAYDIVLLFDARARARWDSFTSALTKYAYKFEFQAGRACLDSFTPPPPPPPPIDRLFRQRSVRIRARARALTRSLIFIFMYLHCTRTLAEALIPRHAKQSAFFFVFNKRGCVFGY